MEMVDKVEQAIQIVYSRGAPLRPPSGGIIWQVRFYDRRIRDAEELEQTRQYIRDNPIKLKLKQIEKAEGL
jgi:hypothetical protein